MKKGAIFGIGIGIAAAIVIISVNGLGYTTSGIPGSGEGLPGSPENNMMFGDRISVTVIPGDSANESLPSEKSSGQTIEVNLRDGVGSEDQ